MADMWIIKDGQATINGGSFKWHTDESSPFFPSKAELKISINEEWSLHVEAPFDADLRELFKVNSLIVVFAGDIIPYNNYNEYQLFRIKQLEMTPNLFTADCVPVFYDAKGYIVSTGYEKIITTAMNVSEVTKILFENVPFQFYISTMPHEKRTADMRWKNLMDCLTGDSNSIQSVWGGEFMFDNYRVIYRTKFNTGLEYGSDYLRVAMGFNMTGITVTYDNSEVVTAIYPMAYNDIPLRSAKPDLQDLSKTPPVSVRSDLEFFEPREEAVKYDSIKLAEDASTEESEDVIVCDTYEKLYDELRKAARADFDENHVDIPNITYDVDFVDLSSTREYSGLYKRLVQLHIGDTVIVKNKDLGIDTTARVISVTYDPIQERITGMTIGDYQSNYFQNQAKLSRATSNVIDTSTSTANASRVAGVQNGNQTQIQVTKDTGTTGDIRVFKVENLKTGDTYGAMAIGTQGIMVTTKRNKDGSGWDWTNGVILNQKGIFYGKLGNTAGTKYIQFNGSGLQTVDGKSTGVGITREANVSSIKTVNGIVVGVG